MPSKKTARKKLIKKDYGWLKGIVLVFLLVGLVDLSIFLLMGPNKLARPSDPYSPISKPHMNNWQAFLNPEEKFSFRYPPGYQVTSLSSNTVQLSSNTTPHFVITIVSQVTQPTQTLDQLIQHNQPCTTVTVPTTVPSTINGQTQAQAYIDMPCGQNIKTVVYTLTNSRFYSITIETQAKYSEVKPYTDQVLSTLKFIDGNAPQHLPMTPTQEQHACTMDARQCPDGSWVGRSGPKCEFVCPK